MIQTQLIKCIIVLFTACYKHMTPRGTAYSQNKHISMYPCRPWAYILHTNPHRYIDVTIYRFINISIHRYIDLSIYRRIDVSTYRYFDRSLFRYIDISIYWFIDLNIWCLKYIYIYIYIRHRAARHARACSVYSSGGLIVCFACF